MSSNDLSISLPKYLSTEAKTILSTALADFPNNIDSRVYTNFLKSELNIFQGDGLKNLLVGDSINRRFLDANCIILSNTCDNDVTNKRLFPNNLVYAPIFSLSKYVTHMEKENSKTDEQIQSHVKAIKSQRITQIFYLPEIPSYLDESLVFLDRVSHCPPNMIKQNEIINRRLFTLSDYGSYLLLYKISLNFSRLTDKVERRALI